MDIPKPVIEIEDRKDAEKQFEILCFEGEVNLRVRKYFDNTPFTSKKTEPLVERLVDYILLKRLETEEEGKYLYDTTMWGELLKKVLKKEKGLPSLVRSWYRSAKMVATCRQIYEEKTKEIKEFLPEHVYNNIAIVKRDDIWEKIRDKKVFSVDHNIFHDYVTNNIRERIEYKDLLLRRIGSRGDIDNYYLPYELLMRLLKRFPADRKEEVLKNLDNLSCNQFRLLVILSMQEGAFTKEGFSKKVVGNYLTKDTLGITSVSVGSQIFGGLRDLKLVYERKDTTTKTLYVCLIEPDKIKRLRIDEGEVLEKIKDHYRDNNSTPITSKEVIKAFDEFEHKSIRRAVARLLKKGKIWAIKASGPNPWGYVPEGENPLEDFPKKHQDVVFNSPYGVNLLAVYRAMTTFSDYAKARAIAKRASLNYHTVESQYLPYLIENAIVDSKGKSASAAYKLIGVEGTGADYEDNVFAQKNPEIILNEYDEQYAAELNKEEVSGGRRKKRLYWALEETRKALARKSKKKAEPKIFSLETIIRMLAQRNDEKDKQVIECFNELQQKPDETHLEYLKKKVLTDDVRSALNRKRFLSKILFGVLERNLDDMLTVYIQLELVKEDLPEDVQKIMNTLCRS